MFKVKKHFRGESTRVVIVFMFVLFVYASIAGFVLSQSS